MRARIEDDMLFVHADDVPPFKKGGPVVRNTYFWALKSICDFAPRSGDWEFDRSVWIALSRMLLAFMESGYLETSATQLEFAPGDAIPPELRPCSTVL
ncbi:MAG: hypothetical protein ACFB9N_12860 [Geitlerinemataceae cyanobacterium]